MAPAWFSYCLNLSRTLSRIKEFVEEERQQGCVHAFFSSESTTQKIATFEKQLCDDLATLNVRLLSFRLTADLHSHRRRNYLASTAPFLVWRRAWLYCLVMLSPNTRYVYSNVLIYVSNVLIEVLPVGSEIFDIGSCVGERGFSWAWMSHPRGEDREARSREIRDHQGILWP